MGPIVCSRNEDDGFHAHGGQSRRRRRPKAAGLELVHEKIDQSLNLPWEFKAPQGLYQIVFDATWTV